MRRSARLSKTPVPSLKEDDSDGSPPPPPAKKAKRIKQKSSPVIKAESNESHFHSAPPNWKIVYDSIRDYRDTHEAPVDTMGCAKLAATNVSDKVARFQTLVSLMLSSQTKDTVTSAAVKTLQRDLPGGLNLEGILAVDEQALDQYIKSVGYHSKKANYIKRTAVILRDQFNGDIPDSIEGLMSLPGVGPKMGYLALQQAWKKNDGIGVDIHVHRITNRLGWCKTADGQPEDTRKSLEKWLPKEYWQPINPLLVGFGQITCLPRGPRCAECPVNQYCPSVEIKKVKQKKVVAKAEEQWVPFGDDLEEEKHIVVKKEEQVTTGLTSEFFADHDPVVDKVPLKNEDKPSLDW
ncbi:DNA glycosylase [Radiomyces spectabilis]|uniref:DNA glycosylase n=1 Tax=Radiomyces spectabilis TaxID=64574 RepID=UPI00221F11FB|nr:DNA glycosylase [Radiomyces spectabilis]KAI8390827.1 DNA glycosylase [Radiomyces spectabilis]